MERKPHFPPCLFSSLIHPLHSWRFSFLFLSSFIWAKLTPKHISQNLTTSCLNVVIWDPVQDVFPKCSCMHCTIRSLFSTLVFVHIQFSWIISVLLRSVCWLGKQLRDKKKNISCLHWIVLCFIYCFDGGKKVFWFGVKVNLRRLN